MPESAVPARHAILGALVIFLLLAFNQLASFSWADAEVAALDGCARPLGQVYASTAVERSPAFLLFLRELSAATRSDEQRTRAVFVLLACGAVAWIWEIARKTLPADWALLAGFLAALSPGLLAAARQVGPWSPGLFLAAAATACLVHALRGVRALHVDHGEDLARRRYLRNRMIGWWAGCAVAAALAVVTHPFAGVTIALALALAAPELRDRRALIGVLGVIAACAVSLALSGAWTCAAYPALFAAAPVGAELPRDAAGIPAGGPFGAALGLASGEFAGAVGLCLLVPAGLIYAGAVGLGVVQLYRAGERGARAAIAVAVAGHLALACSPWMQARAAVFLLPGFALAAATGLMFVGGRAGAALIAVLLGVHLYGAQAFASGRDLLDPSLREPHREIARQLAHDLQPADALLVAGDLDPFWRYFHEKPVRYYLDFGAEGATVRGRKDPSPDSFLEGMRYERRQFWLVLRYPGDCGARADFHRRAGVFLDWLTQNARVVEREPFDGPIPDPTAPGDPQKKVQRMQVLRIDPAQKPK